MTITIMSVKRSASQNALMLWCSLRDTWYVLHSVLWGRNCPQSLWGDWDLQKWDFKFSPGGVPQGSLCIQQDEVQLHSLGWWEVAVSSHLRKHQDSQTVQPQFSGHNMQQWQSEVQGMVFSTLFPLILLGHRYSPTAKTCKESEPMFLLSPCDYQPYWMNSIC